MKSNVLGLAGTLGLALLASSCSEDNKPNTPEIRSIDYPAAYIVNSQSGSLSVIDLRNDTVTETIPLQGYSWPHHISLSPDGNELAVSFPGMDLSDGHHGGMMGMSGGMMVLGSESGEAMHSMQMDAMNHNAVFSPDGRELWTAMMMDSMSGMNSVECYDRSSMERIASIRVGGAPAEITFSMDGAHAFVCNGSSGSVTMIDAATKAVVATIPVGANPVGAWPGVDGLMYVDNEDGKSVSVIDPGLRTVVRTIDLGFTPGYVATPSSRNEFWVTDPDSARVHFFDRTSGDRLGAIPAGAGAHAIVFNRAGTRAYVTNAFAASVSVIDVAVRAVPGTVAVGAKPNGIVLREP